MVFEYRVCLDESTLKPLRVQAQTVVARQLLESTRRAVVHWAAH